MTISRSLERRLAAQIPDEEQRAELIARLEHERTVRTVLAVLAEGSPYQTGSAMIEGLVERLGEELSERSVEDLGLLLHARTQAGLANLPPKTRALPRQCANPDCQKLFVAKNPKRTFCSNNCRSAVGMRDMRARRKAARGEKK